MWSAGKSDRCCATCANWGGCRSANYAGRAETKSPSERGKCFAGVPASATPGPCAMDGRGCGKYTPWGNLK